MRFIFAALIVALLAACAASKPERFHSLLASDTPARQVAPGMSPFVVDVLPVSVPPQVDQPQWLVRAPDDSLQMLEQERWAAPLRDEIRSAVAERLIARWGAVDLRSLAQPAGAVWRVRVDVQRFESMPGREARLESWWSVSSSQRGATALMCRSLVRESVAEAGAPALAAADRGAVARLADESGERVQGMQRGEKVECGGDR